MIARRFASLLLAASLLHVNASRADIACADHAQHAPPGGQQAISMSGNHGDHSAARSNGATVSEEHGEHCHAPSQADCCQAMVSCSLVFGQADAMAAGAPSCMLHQALAATLTAPRSRVAAPDPPPPRS